MDEPVSIYVALYLDEDVTNQIADHLRQRGHDAISAIDVGMTGHSDEEHLGYATERHRTLLTYNESDFVPLARGWAAQGKTHAGILVSDQFSLRQTGELLRRLLNFLDRVTADEMIDVVRYLADYR